MMQALERLADYFESMSAASVMEIGGYYADDAHFKDPFNDVRGVPAIRRVFSHMFDQVDVPRFVVTARMAGADGGAMLVWEFHFRARLGLRAQAHVIRGASHLLFDAAGKVTMHRDYWDAAEELYGKLPVLGGLMRALARKLAA
jgi:steroid delta-isomerase